MSRARLFLASLLFTLAGLPGWASAQTYSIWYDWINISACDTASITGSAQGGYSLPTPTPNAILYITFASGDGYTELESISPAQDSGTVSNFTWTINAAHQPASLPYTITGTVFAYANGRPVGQGTSYTFTCGSNEQVTGPVVITTVASAENVPTLSPWALGAIAMLLAAAAWWTQRRRDA
jgi:hypothetical protein